MKKLILGAALAVMTMGANALESLQDVLNDFDGKEVSAKGFLGYHDWNKRRSGARMFFKYDSTHYNVIVDEKRDVISKLENCVLFSSDPSDSCSVTVTVETRVIEDDIKLFVFDLSGEVLNTPETSITGTTLSDLNGTLSGSEVTFHGILYVKGDRVRLNYGGDVFSKIDLQAGRKVRQVLFEKKSVSVSGKATVMLTNEGFSSLDEIQLIIHEVNFK